MNKIIGIFILYTLSMAADQREHNIDQAYKLYEQKEYKNALEAYQSIEHKNWAILYNMGNTLYNLGDYINAYVYWKRSYDRAPRSELDDIVYNISIVKAKLGVQEEPKTFFEKIYQVVVYYSTFFPLWLVQVIFIVGWFLLFFFIKNIIDGKKYRLLSVGLLILVNGVILCCLLVYYLEKRYQKGIIVKENSALYVGPNEQYHLIKAVPVASEIAILKELDGWYKVRYNNISGWIPKTSLEII